MKFARTGKILTAMVIAVALVVSVNLSGSILAAGTSVISVSAPAQAVSYGTQFTVNINVQPNNAIAGAQFNLSFNPALVSVNSITEGNLFKQGGASTYFKQGTVNNTTGTVMGVAGAITTPGKTVSSAGIFAVITMTAGTSQGTSTLNLSNVIVGEIDGQSISLTVVNNQVTISGGTTTTPTTTTTTTPTTTTTTTPTTTTTTTPTTTTTTTPTTTATTAPTIGGGGGGGGGSVISGPTTINGVTDVTSIVNSMGIFSQKLDITSDDGNAFLLIAANTTGLTASEAHLTQISIKKVTTPPMFSTGAGMIGFAYDFTPSGTTFSPVVTISIRYDPKLIPFGVSETDLQLAYHDSTTNSWITLPSTPETAGFIIDAQTVHFTMYAVTYGVKTVSPVPTTTTPTSTESTTRTTTTPTTTAMVSTTSTLPIPTTTTMELTTLTTAAAIMTTMEPTTSPNNSLAVNPPKFRLSLLAVAIGIAVFLIIAATTIIWLRHRKKMASQDSNKH